MMSTKRKKGRTVHANASVIIGRPLTRYTIEDAVELKAARHVTGAYATNAAGEALPPFYLYNSSAKSDYKFRVKVE